MITIINAEGVIFLFLLEESNWKGILEVAISHGGFFYHKTEQKAEYVTKNLILNCRNLGHASWCTTMVKNHYIIGRFDLKNILDNGMINFFLLNYHKWNIKF